MTSEIQTKFLVVGAGPAGLALASFLGQNGLEGLVIAKAASTSDTPRAHSFNPFAFECLRDLGIEEQALKQAVRGRTLQSMRWSRSMVGEEYGKVLGWSEHPSCVEYAYGLTPCEYAEFSQSELEPLLVRYASHHNFEVRFSTELVAVERRADISGHTKYVCTVHDLISHSTFKIRTRYLFGADGARSHIARSLNFSFTSKPSGGKACNILLRADLNHVMHKERHAALHWILKPDRTTLPGLVAHLRMVEPWKKWVMVGFGVNGTNPFEELTPESPELIACVREIIGDDSVDIEILRMDPWTVRQSVADQYTLDSMDVFLLGDAAHRHPPAYGLGSNTCIQDAYNLGWKIAYVSKGLAGPELLKSYSEERQPVGAMLVHNANQGLHAQVGVWEAVGMFAPSREEGAQQLAKLSQATEEGATSRKKVRKAMENVEEEVQSWGAAYNQWYVSTAVYLEDEDSERPTLDGNSIIVPQVTTYPGSRLPHAWLDVASRQKMISTHDLGGKGAFCLLFGIGGEAWKQAAVNISRHTGIPINAYGIGFGLDYSDVHREWYAKRGVEESGCVLVRPDRFVAWRSSNVPADCEAKLKHVFDKVLSRGGL
ncbi:FAD binding domain protein [Aspergillus parasiticus SU-1]|uniref:FAD binding domain protein n=1 Tax=Aspergillus parasiticus (strain ATCC 56775 / NRRL 5862 / SRRC 143 / SU-1) TaxID=1403190 RepID=A0A0F0I6V7_ASPPU|nr:FAD binding domain protein [Aspergillus parasiticus SU-1]